MRVRLLHQLATLALATTQLHAACNYSPPPLLTHGQAAESLGAGTVAVTGELGYASSGSWWDSSNLTDVDVTDGVVAAGRLRLGVGDDVDVSLVHGYGPQGGFVLGPELKWRFAHLTPADTERPPAFHAAWISGAGFGAARFDNQDGRRVGFAAPYTGLLASGGVETIQMYTGFRFAASETLGDGHRDLTLYPALAFGVHLRPVDSISFFAEGLMAGGLTTTDYGDSAIIVYPSLGATLYID